MEEHTDSILKKDNGVQVMIDNGWNNHKIRQLKRKCEELKIHQYLHNDASSYYKKLHQNLFLPQTSIMTITSGTLFISLSDKINDASRYWINVFVSFLTLIGSILSVWVKFFNAEQKYNDHLNASKNYSLIIDNIEEQISTENDEKENYYEYMDKIKKMINEQKLQFLDIDQKFWDKYFKSISRGELIIMNQNILHEQVTRELNKDRKLSEGSIIFDKNKNNQNNLKTINENDSVIQMNNIDVSNMTSIQNEQNEQTNGLNNEYLFNFDTVATNDLKKKLMYQLQRSL